MRLSKYSLDAALKEKSTRNTRERLKDLPNMSFHLEAILGEVGIRGLPGVTYTWGKNVLVATAAAKQSGDRKDSVYA